MSAGKKSGGGGMTWVGLLVTAAALFWLYHDPNGFQSFFFLLIDRIVHFAQSVSDHFHIKRLVSP